MGSNHLRTIACFAFVELIMGCQNTVSAPFEAARIDDESIGDLAPITPRSSALCQTTNIFDTVAHSPVRMLSPEQYERSVQELLGVDSIQLDLNTDDGNSISLLTAEKLNRAAEVVTAHPSFDALRPQGCTENETACVRDFLAGFGARTFRRPLNTKEQDWLFDTFVSARNDLGFDDAIEVVAQTLLQAPQMLYVRVEGESDNSLPPDIRKLTPYELASRLSFFVLETPPNRSLLDVVSTESFDERIAEEATHLYLQPDARDPLSRRYIEWLELNGSSRHAALEVMRADASKYPQDSASLRRAMKTEIEALVDRARTEHRGSVEWLLTTRDAYVNPALAELYGVEHPTGNSSEFVWVELPADERAGLFTRAGFLSLYAGPKYQSAVKRGSFLIENVFCAPLGEPPPDVSDLPIDGGVQGDAQILTTREAVTAATSSSSCASCHVLINPMGFAFEHYDSLGAWQDVETGETPEGEPYALPVNSAATIRIPLGEFESVDVADAVELSFLLAEDPDVRRCIAARWFGEAMGRAPSSAERCSMETELESFYSSGDVEDLVQGIASSTPFRLTRTAESTGATE